MRGILPYEIGLEVWFIMRSQISQLQTLKLPGQNFPVAQRSQRFYGGKHFETEAVTQLFRPA